MKIYKKNKRRTGIIPSLAIVIFSLIFFSHPVSAREVVTDWYIQNFDSRVTVNKDSSLDITERITADCGSLPGKHGIFRIVPEKIRLTDGETIETPIELISIRDFSGRDLKYSESENRTDATVTWKIGDPDRTVQGVNEYEIRYRVKNAVRFSNPDFDEFYWNLTGNFWDLEMDRAHIEVIFPEEIQNGDQATQIYSGFLGEKGNQAAEFYWDNAGNLFVDSVRTLGRREGITASVVFPKGIFAPYVPSFWEKYGVWFFFLIPLLVLLTCLYLWQKFGRDPREKGTVIAQYEPPLGLSPLMCGMLETNSRLTNDFITAEIIQLAVSGIIKIEEKENKILFITSKDYELTRTGNAEVEGRLSRPQKSILNKIFSGGKTTVSLSSLRNKFYTVLKDVTKEANDILEEKNLIVKSGLTFQKTFLVIGIAFFFFSFLAADLSLFALFSFILSGLIIIIFSFIMPRRTVSGTEANWHLKGFKLFLETVDRDRAKFYEKENMFETCLPYAILFGMTKEWIKKMKEIYGEEYMRTHVPVWYAGAALTSFDADSFASTIDDLSSSIASSTSSPSGSGGSGGAGGGGGGGGGGGW